MANNVVVRYFKEQKQDAPCAENLLHFELKLLCFAGYFPYEKICNTPSKLKLYHAYQITLYVLYCPILISQIVKLYLISEDLQLTIETITHIIFGVGPYLIAPFINWKEVYNLICKIDTWMQNKRLTQTDRKTREILRETRQKCKFTSLFVIVLGIVLIFCNLYEIFILHFVESFVGVEHKYKKNPNAANIYESLLLEKYPLSCWTPFDENSFIAHMFIYIYTVIPVFTLAFQAGSAAAVLTGTLRYISLQFKFVSKPLEDLSNMEDSNSQTAQNTFSTLGKQHPCEKLNYRNLQVSATNGESSQTPSQEQIPECCNVQQYRDRSITTAHWIKDQEHKKDSERLPSDNKLSPEDCVKTTIKNHQEAIW